MKDNEEKKIICFLADKHDLYDDRIYWKMAVPLVEKGFRVYYLLIGEKDKKGITAEGVYFQIFRIKTFTKNRYLNFILKNLNPFNNYHKLFQKAKEIEADIYHFHDLWINKIAVKLKRLIHNPVVFYDAREPYAEDYISYSSAEGLEKKLVFLFAKWVDSWEKKCAKHYDLIIANEEIVRDRFREKLGAEKAEAIFNFTDIYRDFKNVPIENKKYDLIYCGGISELRGVFTMLNAVCKVKRSLPDIRLALIGKIMPDSLEQLIKEYIHSNHLENNVDLIGAVTYSQVSDYYNQSKIGLILLQDIESFHIKMYIKIFEYMAFGLPIIGSNFGNIKRYIEKEKCGIAVNPEDIGQVAMTIQKVVKDSDLYNLYSQNGRKATLEKYKWEFEFERLLTYYNKFLEKR